VVIDEFADLATEDFLAFLDRARSAKIGVVMAHQEIGRPPKSKSRVCQKANGQHFHAVRIFTKEP
jgi:hypothetical protein